MSFQKCLAFGELMSLQGQASMLPISSACLAICSCCLCQHRKFCQTSGAMKSINFEGHISAGTDAPSSLQVCE